MLTILSVAIRSGKRYVVIAGRGESQILPSALCPDMARYSSP